MLTASPCRRRGALPLQHDTGYESDYNRWYHELEGSKLLTSKLARIPEHLIKGSRAPFLACVECPRVCGEGLHTNHCTAAGANTTLHRRAA